MRLPVLATLDPDSTYPYQVDISADLTDLEDTLDHADVAIVDAQGNVDPASDMVIKAVQTTGSGQITFWVSGGSPDPSGRQKRYYVRVRWRGAKTDPIQTMDDVTVVIPVAHR